MSLPISPTPWFICDLQENVVLHGGTGGPFLVAETAMHDREEGAANARLIAAAPDLLKIVKELRESAEYWSEYCVPLGIVDRMDAALEKAGFKEQTP